MGKQRCPQCGKKFDFELSGWICPECGLVILGSTEKKLFQKKNRKIEFDKYVKEKFFGTLINCALVFILLLGIGISVKIPNLVRERRNAEKEAEIVKTSAEMGNVISIAPYTLRVTQAFVPDWDILPKLNGIHYLAVDFVTAGKNQESVLKNLSDIAWVCLHDAEADSYLVPQGVYHLTGSDANQTELRHMNVTSELDKKEGTLIFIVQSPDREYDLCVFTGNESEGYGRYDISVNEQYTIPIKLTDQRTVTGS